MEHLILILGFIVIHWFSDFVLQTDEQAQNKSSSWSQLLMHTYTYTKFTTLLGLLLFLCLGKEIQSLDWFYFFFITLGCHTLTDYYTSRWSKKLIEKNKFHNFFIVMGFDQLLHYFQLFITIHFLLLNG